MNETEKGLNYLQDLYTRLRDPEYAFEYLLACAKDSEDVLRVGIRDLLVASRPLPAQVSAVDLLTDLRADPEHHWSYIDSEKLAERINARLRNSYAAIPAQVETLPMTFQILWRWALERQANLEAKGQTGGPSK